MQADNFEYSKTHCRKYIGLNLTRTHKKSLSKATKLTASSRLESPSVMTRLTDLIVERGLTERCGCMYAGTKTDLHPKGPSRGGGKYAM